MIHDDQHPSSILQMVDVPFEKKQTTQQTQEDFPWPGGCRMASYGDFREHLQKTMMFSSRFTCFCEVFHPNLGCNDASLPGWYRRNETLDPSGFAGLLVRLNWSIQYRSERKPAFLHLRISKKPNIQPSIRLLSAAVCAKQLRTRLSPWQREDSP